MKNIAIFVSGEGEAAERIVKLFNEGNRVKTVLVVVDDSAVSLLQRLQDKDLILLHIPDEEWHSRENEVAALLKENEVKLLVLDDFALSISDEILEATNGEMVKVTNAALAPREVVNVLEADLRPPKVEPEIKTDVSENPTPESEWADTLKIQFTPPKVPVSDKTPENVEPVAEEPNPFPESQQPSDIHPSQGYRHPRHDYSRFQHKEPMPPTWLIWSILVAVFCCFIPGIIAIIFSSQVSSRYYAGDLEGAWLASRRAEIWIIVSFVLGVLAATLYLPFMFLGWGM